MEVSKTEVAEVQKAEPQYPAGLRTLIRSTEAGTPEYKAYRARLDTIDAMARAIRNAPIRGSK